MPEMPEISFNSLCDTVYLRGRRPYRLQHGALNLNVGCQSLEYHRSSSHASSTFPLSASGTLKGLGADHEPNYEKLGCLRPGGQNIVVDARCRATLKDNGPEVKKNGKCDGSPLVHSVSHFAQWNGAARAEQFSHDIHISTWITLQMWLNQRGNIADSVQVKVPGSICGSSLLTTIFTENTDPLAELTLVQSHFRIHSTSHARDARVEFQFWKISD
ncbi:hypothetical protein FB451DRAFT_1187141 [Mycena latifolia]|nr:hypothetical protein FB451DRAFT_1187141 [Mycena latifolia]